MTGFNLWKALTRTKKGKDGKKSTRVAVADEKPDQAPQKKTPKMENSPAIIVVKKYWEAFHAHDIESLKSHCAERCYIDFVDSGVEMTLSEYMEILEDTKLSFPDFTLEMNMEDINEEAQGSDGVTTLVYIRNVRAKGTHTGKPYAFGPFPAIPAKGVFVRDVATNTNEMHIRDGKVTHINVKTDGDANESGPAYFYTQVGGLLF